MMENVWEMKNKIWQLILLSDFGVWTNQAFSFIAPYMVLDLESWKLRVSANFCGIPQFVLSTDYTYLS
jgi:hypothetical protein